MMKRMRTLDVPKFRRPLKNRARLGESVYFSPHNFVYLKFIMVWLSCISLDFIVGFRFELLWPVWLLFRHLYESFRVHAFSSSLHYSAFSVFFVCVTATSDLVCYLFIPIQVLLFLASTYVWMQFVYQSTERGICVPSLILWTVFLMFEYSMRYRLENATWYLTRSSWITAGLFPSTADNVPIGTSSSASSSQLSPRLELYRPFAAHCIGFPVVTLGFRVKSFFSKWRMRLRIEEVMRQNEFLEKLLANAIPTTFENRQHFISSPRRYLTLEQEALESIPNDSTVSHSLTPISELCGPFSARFSRFSLIALLLRIRDFFRKYKTQLCQGNIFEKFLPNFPRNLQCFESRQKCISNAFNRRYLRLEHEGNELNSNEKYFVCNGTSENMETTIKDNHSNSTSKNIELRQLTKEKEMLETCIEKLNNELKATRSDVHELRTQLSQAQQNERICKAELVQSRTKFDQLETRHKQLTKHNDHYKSLATSLEKRVNDLLTRKNELEHELQCATAAANAATANTSSASSKREEKQHQNSNIAFYKTKVSELERELKNFRRDMRTKDDAHEKAMEELYQLRVTHFTKQSEEKTIWEKMATLLERNTFLEQTLSSENRLKQDLFRALNKSKAEIETLNQRLHCYEKNANGNSSSMSDSIFDGVDFVSDDFVQLHNEMPQVSNQYGQYGGPLSTQRQNSSPLASALGNGSPVVNGSPNAFGTSLIPPKSISPLAVANLDHLMQATGAQHMSYSFAPFDSNPGSGGDSSKSIFESISNGTPVISMSNGAAVGSSRKSTINTGQAGFNSSGGKKSAVGSYRNNGNEATSCTNGGGLSKLSVHTKTTDAALNGNASNGNGRASASPTQQSSKLSKHQQGNNETKHHQKSQSVAKAH